MNKKKSKIPKCLKIGEKGFKEAEDGYNSKKGN